MIKGTSTKNKNAQNRLQSLESKGFIEIFVIIVVVVALLIFFGLDPKNIWENLIKPIITWGFDVIINILSFLVNIAIWFVDKIRTIL